MGNRVSIATVGRYGAKVNVFAEIVNGEDAARVEWRELEAHPTTGDVLRTRRRTESFFGPKREREKAAIAFAEGVHARLKHRAPPGTAITEGSRRRLTIRELWDAYTAANAVTWKGQTPVNYAGKWRTWELFAGAHTFADLVSPETVDEFRTQLDTVKRRHGETMARNQIAHHVQLIKGVWKFALRRKLLAVNPLQDYAVRRGRNHQPADIPEFTPEEFAAMLGQLSPRSAVQWRAWCLLALEGLLGRRVDACRHLQWSDVNGVELEGTRFVRWRAETDKTHSASEQSLPRDAVYIFRVAKVWRRRIGYTGPLIFFGSQERTRGKPYTYQALIQALHGACARAGVRQIKYRGTHSLRRMSSGDVLEETDNVHTASQWIGNTDLRVMSKSYFKRRTKAMDRVASQKALPPSPKGLTAVLSRKSRGTNSNQTTTGATRAPDPENLKPSEY